MIWNIKEIDEKIAAELAKVDAIQAVAKDENRDITSEEKLEVDAILGTDDKPGTIQALQADRKRAERHQLIKTSSLSANVLTVADAPAAKSVKVPAVAKRTGVLKSFKSDEDAYISGKFLLATLAGDRKSRQWLKDNGVGIKAAGSIGTPANGGYLVPTVLENALIDNVVNYGTFRQYAQVMPMSSNVHDIPKRAGGFTTYFVGENTAITPSDITLSQVKVEAVKLAALTKFSSELNEDSVISLADFYAQEFARALAQTEDTVGWVGAGNSTHGNITGVAGALAAGSWVTAGSGIVTLAAVTITHFESMIAKLPDLAGIEPAWYVSKPVYYNTMARLQNAAGGNNIADLGNGPELQFLGYPVRFVNVLPTTGVASAKIAYFGDLSLTAVMGVRRGITVSVSDQAYWADDSIGAKVTERFGIKVHDVGDTTNAGAMVGLKLAAS